MIRKDVVLVYLKHYALKSNEPYVRCKKLTISAMLYSRMML